MVVGEFSDEKRQIGQEPREQNDKVDKVIDDEETKIPTKNLE